MRAKIAALSAVFAVAAGLPARARDSSQDPAGTYSYKRPSPTTITSFRSLYDMCVTSGQDNMARSEHSLCVGYFTGLIDFYLTETPVAQRQFCLPTNPPITRQAARDKLVAWAGSNPAAAAQPAAAGVYQFLVASYPCGAASRTTALPAPATSP